MTAQIVWLDGTGVGLPDVGEVGPRAAGLARLRMHRVPVPRGFVLGRSLFTEFTNAARRDPSRVLPKLTPSTLKDLADALRALGGSAAIRRSPLGGTRQSGEWQVITGGRPERETYLHLTDAAEVHEAVRRIWSGQSPMPVAIVVQRFILPEVCAVVRRDPADGDVLHVQSAFGIGDLLAAGLVVPDRHTLRCRDGSVLASSLGRKAQMSIPRADGGVVRVPVPVKSARAIALDVPKLDALAKTWRAAQEAIGQLNQMALAWSVGRWFVTSAMEAPNVAAEGALLG